MLIRKMRYTSSWVPLGITYIALIGLDKSWKSRKKCHQPWWSQSGPFFSSPLQIGGVPAIIKGTRAEKHDVWCWCYNIKKCVCTYAIYFQADPSRERSTISHGARERGKSAPINRLHYYQIEQRSTNLRPTEKDREGVDHNNSSHFFNTHTHTHTIFLKL